MSNAIWILHSDFYNICILIEINIIFPFTNRGTENRLLGCENDMGKILKGKLEEK